MQDAYEKLTGTLGRAVHHRAKRMRPKQIWNGAPITCDVNNDVCKLRNVSITGAFVETDSMLNPGDTATFTLLFDDKELFSSDLLVVRKESGGLAGNFVNQLMDFAKLDAYISEHSVTKASMSGTETYRMVPAEYRTACEHIILFFKHWQKMLSRYERTVDDNERLIAFETSIEKRMRAEWQQLRKHAADAAQCAYSSKEVFDACKAYSEVQLSPHLRSSAILWHAYTKPRGYPGDFQVLNYMYDDTPVGICIFDRIMHQLGREEPLAATVNTRKALLVEKIAQTYKAASLSEKEEIKILSLGSGPAREVEDFLKTTPIRKRLTWSLVDQDEDALEYACNCLRPIILKKQLPVRLNAINLSFGQLFRQPNLYSLLGKQDLIYCAGVMDYLTQSTGKQLIENCFDILNPHGSLFFGNAADDQENFRWLADLALDWEINYRPEAKVREFAATVDDKAVIDIKRDASKIWLFLDVKRKL